MKLSKRHMKQMNFDILRKQNLIGFMDVAIPIVYPESH